MCTEATFFRVEIEGREVIGKLSSNRPTRWLDDDPAKVRHVYYLRVGQRRLTLPADADEIADDLFVLVRTKDGLGADACEVRVRTACR